MKENLGVVQMGSKYYCLDCPDGIPGKFIAPDKIIIEVPEEAKFNEMM